MQNKFSNVRGSSSILDRLIFLNCKNVQVAYRLQSSVFITSYSEKVFYLARFHKTKNALKTPEPG